MGDAPENTSMDQLPSIECEPCRIKIAVGREDQGLGNDPSWNIVEVDLTDKLETCIAHITAILPEVSGRSLFAILHISKGHHFCWLKLQKTLKEQKIVKGSKLLIYSLHEMLKLEGSAFSLYFQPCDHGGMLFVKKADPPGQRQNTTLRKRTALGKVRYFVLKDSLLLYWKTKSKMESHKPASGVFLLDRRTIDYTLDKGGNLQKDESGGFSFTLTRPKYYSDEAKRIWKENRSSWMFKSFGKKGTDQFVRSKMESPKYDSVTFSSKDESEIKAWLALVQPKCINSEPKRIFGVDIKDLMSRADQSHIPSVLVKTVHEIQQRGLDEEGIFRINGSALAIENYRARFDEGEDVDLSQELSIHTICGLFKLYLRELPEPVLTFNLYGKFISTFSEFKMRNPGGTEVSLFERSLLVSQMTEALAILPEPNFRVFKFLAKFLAEVEKHSAQNLMNITNLSKVFGPTLLRTKTSEENLLAEIAELVTDTAVIPEVTAFLIMFQEDMFPRVEEYRQKALLAAELEREKEEAERAKKAAEKVSLSSSANALKSEDQLNTSGGILVGASPSPSSSPSSSSENLKDELHVKPKGLAELKAKVTKSSMSDGDLKDLLDSDSEGSENEKAKKKGKKKGKDDKKEGKQEKDAKPPEGAVKRRSLSETPPVEPEKSSTPMSPRKDSDASSPSPTETKTPSPKENPKKKDPRKARPLIKSGSLGILPSRSPVKTEAASSKEGENEGDGKEKMTKKEKKEQKEREEKERKEKLREEKEQREKEEKERKEKLKEERERKERERKEKEREEKERKEKRREEKEQREKEEKERKEKERKEKRELKRSKNPKDESKEKLALKSPKGGKEPLSRSGNMSPRSRKGSKEKENGSKEKPEKDKEKEAEPSKEKKGDTEGEKEGEKNKTPMTIEEIEEDMAHLVGTVNVKRLKKALFDDVVFIETELRKLAKQIIVEESNEKLASLVQFQSKIVSPQVQKVRDVLVIPADAPAEPTGSVIVDPKRRLKHTSAMTLLEDVRIFQTIKQLLNVLHEPKRLLALSSVLAEVLNTFKYLTVDVAEN